MLICGFTGRYTWHYFLARTRDLLVSLRIKQIRYEHVHYKGFDVLVVRILFIFEQSQVHCLPLYAKLN